MAVNKKNEKRKAPSQALRAAQLQNTCVPFKHTRSNALGSTEASKLDAAMQNDASFGWTLTSCKKTVSVTLLSIDVTRRTSPMANQSFLHDAMIKILQKRLLLNSGIQTRHAQENKRLTTGQISTKDCPQMAI
jgi:hypothetical protein